MGDRNKNKGAISKYPIHHLSYPLVIIIVISS